MRTLLTATAIAVGGFTLTITLAASNGSRAYVDKILQENFDPAELFVYRDKAVFGEDDKTKPKEYSEDGALGSVAGEGGNLASVKLVTEKDIEQLRKLSYVEKVTPLVQVTPEYVTREGQKKYTATFQQFGSRQNLPVIAGKQEGKPGSKEVLIPEPFVSALGFRDAADAVGKSITVAVRPLSDMSQKTNFLERQAPNISEFKFTIIGVRKNVASQQPGTNFAIYAYNEDLQQLHDVVYASQPAYRSHATVIARIKDGNNENTLKDVQGKLTGLGYESKSSKDLQKLINNFISTLQIVIVVFSVITVIASIFGIVNTMYISVLERTREIGLMKALGMSKRAVSALFTFEAIWIGFIGGAMGVVGGLLFGIALNPVISEKLELGEGVSLLEYHWTQMLALIGVLMAVAMVAGILPAFKASRLDPIEALRTE